VALTLMAACLIGTAAALLVNRFITFPLFLGEKGVAVFTENYVLIVAFNMIKTLSIGILTLLLYKRLSNFLKKLKI
jgi:riboflavin transporter FmnP